MKSLLSRLLFPLLFAIIAYIPIAIFFPFEFNFPYQLEQVDYHSNLGLFEYYDMDNDGESELMKVYFDKPFDNKYPYVRIHKGYDTRASILEQVNLKNQKLTRVVASMIGDYDDNGLAEFFVFSIKDTTIFLEAFEYSSDTKKIDWFLNKEIIAVNFHKGQYDVSITQDVEFTDLNNDGFKECIFIVNGLYTAEPRHIYAYDIKNDSLWNSNTGSISLRLLETVKHNNKTYFSVFTPAHLNCKEPLPTYHDHCGWAMLFDENLELLFKPDSNKNGHYYHVRSFPVIANDSIHLLSFFGTPPHSKDNCEVRLYNSSGEIVQKVDLKAKGNLNFSFIDLENNSIHITAAHERQSWICEITDKINVTRLNSKKSEILNQSSITPVTLNGEDLQLGINYNTSILTLYSKKLVGLAELKIPKNVAIENFSVGKIEGRDFILFSNYFSSLFIEVLLNPLYKFRWLFHLLIFLVLFIFFWILKQVFNYQIRKQQLIREELTRNQLAISKRQLEPHFMLNTLNNIGQMFAKEDKKEAQYYFGKYASLLNRGLMYADQIETSLQEELQFIRDYLILQQKRFDGNLNFTIEAEENVDLSIIKIPHSLLFTFVENAVKHGLVLKKEDRVLSIHISKENKRTKVVIVDNGIGREQSKLEKTSGTGKGMQIVKSIVSSYNKLKNRNISFQLIDLLSDDGAGTGTEVRILI